MPRRARTTHVGWEGSGYPRAHHLCFVKLSSIEQISPRVATHRGTGTTCQFEQTDKGRTYLQPPERTDRRSARRALSEPSPSGPHIAEHLSVVGLTSHTSLVPPLTLYNDT